MPAPKRAARACLPPPSVRFVAPGGNLDRFGSLVVEGWRCPLASVVEAEAPPGHERH